MSDIFIQLGYWGMAIAAFIAGSVFPFSSEAVMTALLLATDMDPIITVASATIGNVGGSMFNYGVGRLCKTESVTRRLKIDPRRMQKAQAYVQRYGSWIAFFAFVPILGSAISVALGMMRARILPVLLFTFIGKLLRYAVIAMLIA